MEILASKLNTFTAPSKTPKGAVPKAGITFEQLSAYNKENTLDSVRRDKSNSRIDESLNYQSRARSHDKRNGNQAQNSYILNRNENTATSSSGLANFSNFFNSPKGAEAELFKAQEKNSYTAKHVSKGLKSSFKQDEKDGQNGISDQYLQSKIDQIVNSSLSLRDRSKNNASASKINPNTNSQIEDKVTEKTTLYTRLLNDMRTSTPKGKNNISQEQQSTNNTKASTMVPANEFYTRNPEAKKPYLDLKLSSIEVDNNAKIAKEEAKAIKSFQRMSFSQKKGEDNSRQERGEHQEQPRRGDSAHKQERAASTKGLIVNTHTSSEPQMAKHPMTSKTIKSGSRNDNPAMYESLTNLKKTLDRPNNNLTRSTTLNGAIYNNFVAPENREAKPIFKSVTPKANVVSSSEVKSVLQAFKTMGGQRDNSPHITEDRYTNTSSTRKTLDDETYQNYLKERSHRNEERANGGNNNSSHHQRPPSSSKTSKYRESSLNVNRRPEEKNSFLNSTQNSEKEKANQKNLKDFVTQVNPAGNMPFKSKLDINVQNNEKQSYTHLQAQSAKHSNRPGANDKNSIMGSINAMSINKAANTTTNSSIAQESKSFTFNSSLINKHSSANIGMNNDERNSMSASKKEMIMTTPPVCPYYMAGIEKYIKNFSTDNEYFSKVYREHFLQSFQAINFCKYLKPVDPAELAKKKVYLPKKECYKDKKTIIFDLDETLIHCNENANIPCDVVLPIKFPHGDIIEAGINIRPYAVEALEELSKHFELIVFTASHSCYANVVLDYLDPQNKYIQHRLYRENCVTTEEGLYIKDLRIFANRNLKDIVIVDNAMYSFGYQFENGIPIIPYYYHKGDTELKTLVPYLKSLYHVKDVREVNIKSFKLHNFAECESHDELLQKLFE